MVKDTIIFYDDWRDPKKEVEKNTNTNNNGVVNKKTVNAIKILKVGVLDDGDGGMVVLYYFFVWWE